MILVHLLQPMVGCSNFMCTGLWPQTIFCDELIVAGEIVMHGKNVNCTRHVLSATKVLKRTMSNIRSNTARRLLQWRKLVFSVSTQKKTTGNSNNNIPFYV